MSLVNKILLAVIAIASAAFFFMGARTLSMHQKWRSQVQKSEQELKNVENARENLIDGAPNQPGIRQLQVEVARLMVDRSRAWFNCDAKVTADKANGSAAVTVTTDQPNPNGIAAKTTLYVFEDEEAQKGGRYLGEFLVTKSDEAQKQVVLTPASRLDAADIDRLTQSKRPWTLYDVMPHDNREVAAPPSAEEKKDASASASEPRRDYQVLLAAARAQKTLVNDRIAALTAHNKLLDAALVSAKKQSEAVKGDVEIAKQDRSKMEGERDTVAAYRKLTEKELVAAKKAIADLIKDNKATAGQIAALQDEAVRRIDQRSRAMARSNAGG